MRRRAGVTLVELLVVIAIITALSTLIIAVAPKFGERQRSSRGAGQLQGWLNLAKQRALRDRRPVGIRLPHQNSGDSPQFGNGAVGLMHQAASAYVRELQFVQTPDDTVAGTFTVPYNPPPDTAHPYRYLMLTSPVQFNPAIDDPAAPLKADDLVVIRDGNPRRVLGLLLGTPYVVPGSNPPQYNYIVILDSDLTPAQPLTATTEFRLYRKARPIVGEPVLQLPKDVAIDVSRDFVPGSPAGTMPRWYRMFPPTANTGGNSPFDILFSPSGQVIGFEGNLGSRICLWVRDVSINAPGPMYTSDPFVSEPTVMPPGVNTLVTIYTRTGQIAVHSVDPTGLVPNATPNAATWNPFRFSQDGLTSGS
jgi:prepilin-type N-terminal cleavage/methylation domain-containing protein